MENLPVLIAILVVLITLALFAFIFLRKRVKRDGVLLMGLSDSGKTLIFARLAYGEYVETFTSMKENVEEYSAGKASLQLVDIPGQERVRGRVFDDFKQSARAIVYVVDSAKVQQEIRDVAEYLHNILCDEAISSNKPALLVLCNKQDGELSKSSSGVRSLLEKELNIVRSTKASQRKLDGDGRSDITLGDLSKTFTFDDLPMKVEFAESSAVVADEDNGPNLDQLEDWIATL